MKKHIFTLFILVLLGLNAISQVSLTATDGTLGPTTYTNLRLAFAAINSGTHRGIIEITITTDFTDNNQWVLNASGSGSANYNSVSIFPYGERTIAGNYNGSMLYLNGASYVTIDGLDTLGNSLTISNTRLSTSASTIHFVNGASNNIITNCSILGSSIATVTTNLGRGIISFGESTGSTGNNNNTISYNNITHAGDSSTKPVHVIYSFGTSGKPNTGNNISNNNIYNFFRHGTGSYAIHIRDHSTDWNITGNSFYENFLHTTANITYTIINIINTSGNNFTISNNYIGGSEPGCGGTAWTSPSTLNNTFYGIYLDVGTSTASNIQGNTISNFNWPNSGNGPWYGIRVQGGNVNIGTTAGNTLGASTGTSSITYTSGTTGGIFYGIYLNINTIIDCQNNTIASITTEASSGTDANSFYGVFKTGAGATTISNNTIGCTSTFNSINASSTSTSNQQDVYGISSAGSGIITISGNTIANLTNGTTNASTAATSGLIRGISVTNGTNTITNNKVSFLSIANANTLERNTASAIGILFNTTNASAQNISQNEIFGIQNIRTDFAGTVTGLFYRGPGTESIVSGNYIHSLGVDGSSTGANIYGIRIDLGTTTFSNNIITLGDNTQTNIYGIYENSSSSTNTINLYFNTVYIGGVPTDGTQSSYAFWSNSTTPILNIRNNIFVNERSNQDLASGSHYAAWFNYTENTNLTLDYNNYYIFGNGGVLGRYNNADVTILPIVTDHDANSTNENPIFSSGSFIVATKYKHSNALLKGVAGTGITIDYEGITRDVAEPIMGAFEKLNLLTINSTTTISDDESYENVIVEPNGTLTLEAGSTLTVTGNFTIESDENGTGSFIDNGTLDVSGDIIVQKYLASTNGYGWTVTAPVQTAPHSVFDGHINTYYYNPLTPGWAVYSSGNMDNMRGYWTKFNSNRTLEFNDVLNTGEKVYSNFYRTAYAAGNMGWNFIGNPYPSPIDWSLVVGLTENGGSDNAAFITTTKLNPTVYIAGDDGEYVWYTDESANTFNGIIPAATAFWIQVYKGDNTENIDTQNPIAGAQLTLKNSVRVHGSGGSKSTATNLVKLNLQNNNFSDMAIVRLKQGTSLDFEPASDALKMLSQNLAHPQLYSVNNDDIFALNSITDDLSQAVAIPLGLITGADANLTINADVLSVDANVSVYLEDTELNIMQDLKTNPIYTFNSTVNQNNDRFVLHLAANNTSIESNANESFTSVYTYDNAMYINLIEEKAVVSIFNMLGQEVFNSQLTNGLTKLNLNLVTGSYIVNVISGNKVKTEKVFIK